MSKGKRGAVDADDDKVVKKTKRARDTAEAEAINKYKSKPKSAAQQSPGSTKRIAKDSAVESLGSVEEVTSGTLTHHAGWQKLDGDLKEYEQNGAIHHDEERARMTGTIDATTETFKTYDMQNIADVDKVARFVLANVKGLLKRAKKTFPKGYKDPKFKWAMKRFNYQLRQVLEQKRFLERHPTHVFQPGPFPDLASFRVASPVIGLAFKINPNEAAGLPDGMRQAMNKAFKVWTEEGLETGLAWLSAQISELFKSPVHCQPGRPASVALSPFVTELDLQHERWKGRQYGSDPKRFDAMWSGMRAAVEYEKAQGARVTRKAEEVFDEIPDSYEVWDTLRGAYGAGNAP